MPVLDSDCNLYCILKPFSVTAKSETKVSSTVVALSVSVSGTSSPQYVNELPVSVVI